MKIAFDLDGTLDKPAIAQLALVLDRSGHEVHVITGAFPDAKWQSDEHKIAKMERLGLHRFCYDGRLHSIIALETSPSRNLDYVLRDLGLRKGALCEELGIEIIFDDSALYCDMVKKVSNTVPCCVS